MAKRLYFIFFSMMGSSFASDNGQKKIESPFDIRFPGDNIFKDVAGDYLEAMAKNGLSQENCNQMEKTPDNNTAKK